MMLPKIFQGNLMSDLFDDSFFSDYQKNQRLSTMKTDIKEKDGNYLLDIELPGYGKENVSAELKDGYLTISAKKEESKEEKDEEGNFIRKERYSGSCQRSFYVGKTITEDDIDAKFVDGVLKIVVPKEDDKKIETNKKQINIR